MQQISPLDFFSTLHWIDGRQLMSVIEPYRAKIFEQALYSFDDNGRPRFNLVLNGRAKKNWKSADLILAGLYRLLFWESSAGNQCYILANDEDQASDNLELAKKIVEANPLLKGDVDVKNKIIERQDGKGFLEILPAGDVIGSHGKTYLFAGFDEIHGYKTWDLLEAMQLDPTRADALMWITSYASIYHKPGVPLFDLFGKGKKGADPRMFFSWYAADYTTDPEFAEASPEERANPSRGSWEDQGYLEQQQSRLPSHKYRRLHLNLPGLPEGSAFTAEMIMGSIDRGVRIRPYSDTLSYFAFVDMSGGSSDDAVLAIAHKDADGRAVLDRLVDQGQRPPFDPRKAVTRFAEVLKEYKISSVTGDKYAGETFVSAFKDESITYRVSKKSKHEIYESVEPGLNGSLVVLLDHPEMESQFLSLLWRGSRIDHPGGEHDDFCNAVAGAVDLAIGKTNRTFQDLMAAQTITKGKVETVMAEMNDEQATFWNELTAGPVAESMSGLIADAYAGKSIDWATLSPEERRSLERQLQVLAREMRIHGDRDRAEFFLQQLDQAPHIHGSDQTSLVDFATVKK